jgi:hypothetical protein
MQIFLGVQLMQTECMPASISMRAMHAERRFVGRPKVATKHFLDTRVDGTVLEEAARHCSANPTILSH